MSDHDVDPGFERYVAERLRAYAEEGIAPFDAVEIAHNAARGRSRNPAAGPAAGLPRPLRWIVLSTAAFALLAVGAFAMDLLLPDRQAGPSPTAAALLSPPPSPDGRSLPPIVDPDLIPDPNVSAGPNLTPAPNVTPAPGRLTPEPSDMAAGPGDSPEPDETKSPPASPGPEPTASPLPSPSPVPQASIGSVVAGDLHYCVVLTDRRIVCWGENSEGELGDGTTVNRWSASVAVEGIDDARQVAAGTRFSCAARQDGSVWCWGAGIQGGGSGSTTPERVPDISDATAVTAGAVHACALRANGRVACWGLGQLGQLGNGTIVHNDGNPPVQVSGLDDVRQISAGWNHTCALRGDGTVWCWGGNGDGATGYGQIGDGTFDNAPSPVQVQGLGSAAAVAAGGWSSCAVQSDGTAWCWGYGERGGLGDGPGESSALPVQVSELNDARQIDVGGWHACALRASGRLACWGANEGQLGDGSRLDRYTPVAVSVLRNVTDFSAGWIDTCAVRRDASLWCWGSNHGTEPARQEVNVP